MLNLCLARQQKIIARQRVSANVSLIACACIADRHTNGHGQHPICTVS
jgi:hypothetical protein